MTIRFLKFASIPVIILCILALSLSACESRIDNYHELIGKTPIIQPLDHGQGIFYFPATGVKFGDSLSVFMQKFDNLELIAIASDNASGVTFGYFVAFKERREN